MTLIQQQEKALDRVQSHLIADLIHDVRTPLVAVRGYSKMMLEERVGTLTSTQREYLTIMVENTNRTIHLLNELVHLATEPPLSFEPIGVRDLWNDSVELWKSRALAKSIQIQEKIPSESLVIRGNRHMLREAFEVLLSNAVRFAKPGDEIGVEFSGGGGKKVEVRISDSRDRITVDPTYSISDGSQPGDAPGQSLEEMDEGLSLVRDIISLHGGQISVTNQGRRGSTLILTLPA